MNVADYIDYVLHSICMYVCMYIYVCIYMYVNICMYVYMYMYVYVYICMYMYVYICICMYMYICQYVAVVLSNVKKPSLNLSSGCVSPPRASTKQSNALFLPRILSSGRLNSLPVCYVCICMYVLYVCMYCMCSKVSTFGS